MNRRRHRCLSLWPLLFILGCGKSTADWVALAAAQDPAQRLQAIHALGDKIREKEAVLPVLTQALQDDNTYVRRDAARALAQFGPDARDAIPALQATLQDREPSVRKAVAHALKQIEPSQGKTD